MPMLALSKQPSIGWEWARRPSIPVPWRDVLVFTAGAGLGASIVGVVAYRHWGATRTQRISSNPIPSTSKTPTITLGSHLDTRSSPDTGERRILQLEGQFFTAIARKANLTDDQLTRLKDFVRPSTRNDPGMNNVSKLDQLLHLLRKTGVILARRYRLIISILQNANLGIDVNALEVHVEKLLEAVAVVESGQTPRDFEADFFDMDVLILYADDDRADALEFRNHLIRDIGIDDMSAKLYEEAYTSENMGEMFASVFRDARYIFVYVTHKFTQHRYNRYGSEIALTRGLLEEQNKQRIIPVWTTEKLINIVELMPILGVSYWQWNTKPDLRQMYRMKLQQLIRKGREEIVRG